MSATPYPQNLYHSGSAKPLALDVALNVPPTGDITISVSGNAASKGWVAIPNGNKMVVTLGRATQYEAKYLVSSVSSGQSSSTLTVLAEDRNYDGTIPVNAPAGTVVEHTVSATEMSTINDHMRTKQAHGSDGDLVDQNSAQALSNKTFATPTDPSHAATKQYVDSAATTAANAALPKSGGTMTGAIAMGGSKVTGLGSGTATGDAVTKGQLDAVSGRVTGGYVEWTTSGSGEVTVTLSALPSGASAWFMTVNGTVPQPWAYFVQISGTTATVYIADANTGVGIGGGVSVSFFYTAVAV